MQKKMSVQLVALFFILFLSLDVFGDKQGVELGIGINRFLFGGDIGLDDEYGLRANLGYRFNGPIALEWSYNEVSAETILNNDIDVTHWYVDLLYHFNSGGSVEPYFALGYGVADADIVDGDFLLRAHEIEFCLSCLRCSGRLRVSARHRPRRGHDSPRRDRIRSRGPSRRPHSAFAPRW